MANYIHTMTNQDIMIFTKDELEGMLLGQVVSVWASRPSDIVDGRLIGCMSEKQFEEETTPAMDWDKAKAHLYEVITNHIALGWEKSKLTINYKLMPLRERYDRGERTRQLYNEIMGCE